VVGVVGVTVNPVHVSVAAAPLATPIVMISLPEVSDEVAAVSVEVPVHVPLLEPVGPAPVAATPLIVFEVALLVPSVHPVAASTRVLPAARSPAALSVSTTVPVVAVAVLVPDCMFVAREAVVLAMLPMTEVSPAALAGCTMSPSDITIATSTAAVLKAIFLKLKTVLQDYPFV